MFSSYLPELADRIKEVAKLALVTYEPNIQVLNYPDSSGHNPFFALQLGAFNPNDNSYAWTTEDFTSQVRTFTLHLIYGKVTGGYTGENADKQYLYDELIVWQFKSNRLLLSTAYPATAAYLDAFGISMNAGTGARFIQYGGVDNIMLASSFTITAPVHIFID